MLAVYNKTLHDKRWFIVWWSVVFLLLTVLLAAFYPSMRISGLDKFVASMPEAFKGMVGDLSLLNSFDTYIASQMFDIRFPLIAGIMAIILGINLGSADEDSGELKTYLAMPISRVWLAVQKWLVIVTITLLITFSILLGIWMSVQFVDGAKIELSEVLSLGLMSWLLMVTFGTIPFAISVALGRRSVAMGVAVAGVIGSFILSTFGSSIDWLSGYEKISLIYYFPAVDILKNGIQLKDSLVLVTVTLVLLIVSMVLFRKRDVR